MFKRTWNQPHFLKRAASHSTKGARTGRVDVLPPEARTPLWSIAAQIETAAERVEKLRAERDAAKEALHTVERFEQLRSKVGSGGSEEARIKSLRLRIEQLETEMRRSRRRVNELRAIVAGGADLSFESIFVQLARVELPDDLYDSLAEKAGLILRRAR